MDRERFNEIVESFMDKERSLLIFKGDDYSTDKEALRNFQEAASLLDMRPSEVAFVYMTKHLSSIKNLVQNPKGQNLSWAIEKDGKLKEGNLQKISDLRNYAAIIAMCLEEELGIKCEF